jgi:hypothetical protein
MKLKFSEWLDKTQEDRKFCVDEQCTEQEFINGIVLSYFIKIRGGVSMKNAASMAAQYFKKLDKELSGQ